MAIVASVVALWRYPVKSMQGEELNSAGVGPKGLWGDRAFALIDAADGKVASAKNPRKWPGLFAYRGSFETPPGSAEEQPHVWVTLPDGTRLSSKQHDIDLHLSQNLGRDVTLRRAGEAGKVLEEFWPDMDGLPHRNHVSDEKVPDGTFFDCASVHLLTTSSLDRLRTLYPQGRFEARRFRPNIVLAAQAEQPDFLENKWVGKVLAIGKQVRLQVTGPCPRCIMTTLPQSDLPVDAGILKTAVQNNNGQVGIYAEVLQPGVVRRGDSVSVE